MAFPKRKATLFTPAFLPLPEFRVISFLSLPIRLIGIVLMAAFLVNAMSPLSSFELKLANINAAADASVIAQTAAPSSDGLSLLPIGLSLIAIISIWLIYQTYRQHIGLANNELRNRSAAEKFKH
jgi:hypothetical protein